MSYETRRKEIQAHFAANFTAVAADKIAWDNVEFEPPSTEAWIRFNISYNIAQFVSTGGPSVKNRKSGLILIQVFIPENSSTLLADQIVDAIADTLEGKQLVDGVTFKETTPRAIGNKDSWYQVNVTTPFYHDDIRPLP